MNAFTYYRELLGWLLNHARLTDMFLVQSVVTCCALFWLLHRAWQTLWKPVPELINILGVEVPEPPAVSLAGIKVDAITLHWERPGSNKPVLRYLIQVNGVNVGESSRQETAITVTGLKAGHYYNVRVIAVGNNNFQAGSRVIRLRTYGKDGRPELGSGRILEDQATAPAADSSDEGAGIKTHGTGIENAATESAPAMVREVSNGHPSQRRNVSGRKRSASTAGDVAPIPTDREGMIESVQQLTERFEDIRKQNEEIVQQSAKDAEEFKAQQADLVADRDGKRQVLKEKDEASEKLKREVHNSERSNRQAQNRKTTKEKALRDKQAERTKMRDDLDKWERDIQDMDAEKEKWEREMLEIGSSTEEKADELRRILRRRQNSLNGMEEEIRVKGLQIEELKAERQKLPGEEEDEDAKERDAAERQKDIAWEHMERSLQQRFINDTNKVRSMLINLDSARTYQNTLLANQQTNAIMYGAASAVDFEGSTHPSIRSRKVHRQKSRTNTMSSPAPGYSTIDASFTTTNYSNAGPTDSPSFAPGPYFDLSASTGFSASVDDMSEAEIRQLTGGAPLSPTATSLLPSSLFVDDEPSSPRDGIRSLGPSFHTEFESPDEQDRHSPDSSSRSASHLSSPRTSANHLQNLPQVTEEDHFSRHPRGAEFGIIGSPSMSSVKLPTPAKRTLQDIFRFKRGEAPAQEDGLVLGSFKAGQSQSFPRQTEESEAARVRNRRTSISTGLSSFLGRGQHDVAEGNAPALSRTGPTRRKGFRLFGADDLVGSHPERDPSSPRPASIASSDLPRPSMEANPFGWPSGSEPINRNSPLAANWSAHYGPAQSSSLAQPWAVPQSTSRRPSVQHGSSTALASGLIPDDDEDDLLPPHLLSQQTSPPSVGVIGGPRPQSARSTGQTPRLNPTAPTFKLFGRKHTDKGSDRSRRDTGEFSDDLGYTQDEAVSPTNSRKSRDQHSIHTQTSMAESYESLDRTTSTANSEANTPSGKGENSLQKLLRKGSSSKFSIASLSSLRGKDVFGSKSKVSTPAIGDRGSGFGDMDELNEDSLLGRSYESVSSSPMVGSRDGTPSTKERKSAWNRFSISGGRKGKDRVKESSGGDGDMSLTSGAETTEDEREE